MSKAPKTPFTRNSIACEYCRARRRKCQPPFPCKACRDAGIKDCQVRELARPQRKVPRPTNAIDGTAYPDRARVVETIDHMLEQIYEQQTGTRISLALNETLLHPLCDLHKPAVPLPPLPYPPHPSVADALTVFLTHLLPYAGYIPPARIESLFQRWLAAPDTLSPDQTSLILGCIASGYVRLQSRDPEGRPIHVAAEDRLDVVYFRHATKVLEDWGSATFTSLHALSTLWSYSIMTCPSSTILKLASWHVAQAQELGIHQDQAPVAYGPSDRADLMLIRVLYAHFWATSLICHPPVIRTQDLERTVVRARPVPGDDETVFALVPRRSLSELLLFNTKLLMTLHDSKLPSLSMEWLHDTEERWEGWCNQYIATGRTTGSRLTDPFLDILWDWGRITLRVPTLADKRLAIGSMSIIARSAVKIIAEIYVMYSREVHDVNMVWQHLRSVVTCAHIALLAFWKYELREVETADALQQALHVLGHMQTRWGGQAMDAIINIYEVARGLGVRLQATNSGSYVPPPLPVIETPPDDINAIPASLGFLYETFDSLNSGALNGMEWSIDSMLFTQEL